MTEDPGPQTAAQARAAEAYLRRVVELTEFAVATGTEAADGDLPALHWDWSPLAGAWSAIWDIDGGSVSLQCYRPGVLGWSVLGPGAVRNGLCNARPDGRDVAMAVARARECFAWLLAGGPPPG